MEFRVLRYFLAVANEGSISKAAESLYLSQPTLSRQIKELEEELGKSLLIRGNKKITLTDEGRLLRKRAQEIVDLSEKTRSEISSADDHIGGDIYIGGGEAEGMRLIAKTICTLQKKYPNIRVHLFSGNVVDITERLDKGLLDFGVLVNPSSLANYDFIRLPYADTLGLLMRKDSPLSSREVIKPDDLFSIPIIAPRNEMSRNTISKWMGREFETLNIVATFNLILNAALMVEEGVGYALALHKFLKLPDEDILCLKPFEPILSSEIFIVWKKYQVFSKASEKFLESMQREFSTI